MSARVANYVLSNDVPPPPYSSNPFASVGTINAYEATPRSSDVTLVNVPTGSSSDPQPRKWLAGFFKSDGSDLDGAMGDFIHPKVDRRPAEEYAAGKVFRR